MNISGRDSRFRLSYFISKLIVTTLVSYSVVLHAIVGLHCSHVKNQPTTITEFDETLVSRLIEKITVFGDRFTVDFKSGITIDIEA